MAKVKTNLNDQSVFDFLNSVTEEKKRADSFAILTLMKEVTQQSPQMWGDSIVGFGTYHYKYKSGREGDWFLAGFSPRKQSLTIYIMGGFSHHEENLKKLGNYTHSKACLYIKKLEDINIGVLKEIIAKSIIVIQDLYPQE